MASVRIVLLCLVFCPFLLWAETVRIGYFPGYPTNYLDEETGTPSGSTILFLRDFLTEAGLEPEFVGPFPFPRLLIMLKNGEIDGLLGFSYVQERTEYVYYPDAPYRSETPYIFFHRSIPVEKIESVEEVTDYKYSYRSGGALPDFLRDFQNTLDITYLSRDTWIDQSLRMLSLRRIDGIITTTVESIRLAAGRLGLEDIIKPVRLPGVVDPLYLGISKASSMGRELLDRYNENLKTTDLNISDYDEN